MSLFFFFLNNTATTEIYTLSFHDALPIKIFYVSQDGALDDVDLDAIARLSELLTNDYAVVGVTSVTTLLDRFAGNHTAESLELAAGFPQVVEASGDLINLASGGDVAVIRAEPRWSP